MLKTFITIFLFLIATISKGQISKDSIEYVYFYPNKDSIIIVTTKYTYQNQDFYYCIKKVIENETSRKVLKASYCSKEILKQKLDSVTSLGYLIGLNISNECKNIYVLHKLKKRQWSKSKRVKYSVTDLRMISGDTLFYNNYDENFYMFKGKDRENEIKEIFTPRTYVCFFPQNQKRYCIFESMFLEHIEGIENTRIVLGYSSCKNLLNN